MATQDVTRVLRNPRYTSKYDLYQDVSTVIDGLLVPMQLSTLGLVGVVQPAGAKSLDLLPEGERRTASVDVWTSLSLTQGYQGRDADEIVWQSSRYRVMSVVDWTNFGRGFVKATCSLMQVNPSVVVVPGPPVPSPAVAVTTRVATGSSPAASTIYDYLIIVNGPTVLDLVGAPPDGTTHAIKLMSGNSLDVVAAAGDTIDGQQDLQFTEPHQAMVITYRASVGGWVVY